MFAHTCGDGRPPPRASSAHCSPPAVFAALGTASPRVLLERRPVTVRVNIEYCENVEY
jgi:hypothetical protein